VLIDAFEPRFNISEGDLISDVKSDNDSIGLLVEGISDRFESFLSSCVPNLNCDILTLRRFVGR
jgi:hypothetical protein